MRRLVAVVATLLSTMVAATVLAAPSATASTQTSLRITITPLNSTSPVSPISATLLCDPAGGTHPFAERACAEIDATFGNIAAIRPMPGMFCLAVWQPVQISVQGVWRWQQINFSEVQSNLGCARISHGHVFYL